MARSSKKAQMRLAEKVLENPGLEDALEQREEAKGPLKAAQADYKEADDTTKALIETAGLDDGIYRVGGFQLTIATLQGKTEDKPRTIKTRRRIGIKLDEAGTPVVQEK